MEHIEREQKALLSLLGANVFGSSIEYDPDVDWKKVANEARAQAVFSIAFVNYKDLPLGEELSGKVRNKLMAHMVSNTTCHKNHTYLHRLMQENGISYCVIKGAASASYYPDPILRDMGDVDFYVHPDDVDRAFDVFMRDGFVREFENNPTHIVLFNQKKHFEMHFKPLGYHEGKIGEILKEYWSDIRECAVLRENELSTFYAPSAFHHGFIMLTHFQHHLFHEGVGLRHVLDWAVFANSFTNEEFLDIFEARLKRVGLFRLAQILSLIVVKHMGMEHRAWMGDDYETADEILSDILIGGNFGKKDFRRAYEGLFTCDRDKGNLRRGRIFQLFSSMNSIIDTKWSAAKKFPLLYPVGWLFFSAKYFFKLLFKKKRLNIFAAYKKSGQRIKKYSKLRVFEPEK